MKIIKNLAATLLFVCFIFSALFGQNATGVYKTDFNELTLWQEGNKITGSYKHQNGRIEASISGRIITGWWYQSNGKGRLRFELNSDGSGFKGLWSYDDAEPNKQWNGTKTGQSETIAIAGVFKTDFSELTIVQNGTQVTGTYKHQNGRIEGSISGNILTGWWYQSNGKGRFKFIFSADGSSFKGLWSYNEAEPASKWDGTRN